MAKSQVFDDALASVRAVEWQALPPAAQRAFFAGLTSIVLPMLEADITPDGKRRTNVDRARLAVENDDKLTLIRTACISLQPEAMSEDELRAFHNVLKTCVCEIEVMLQMLPTGGSDDDNRR